MKLYKISFVVLLVVLLSSCSLFEKHYIPYTVECDTASELKDEFGLFETTGLIEYGYDVPSFESGDEASIYICENDLGEETWYFGTRIYEEEDVIVELDNFFVDIDFFLGKIEEYNEANEMNIVLHENGYMEMGPLSAWNLENSDLSDFSPNLLMLVIGRGPSGDDVGVVKYPDNTFKIITFGNNEYIELIDLSNE